MGRARNLRREVSVGSGCEYHHVMVHEIGHVIGFWHEQSRPDRDQYVKIIWKNINRGQYTTFVMVNARQKPKHRNIFLMSLCVCNYNLLLFYVVVFVVVVILVFVFTLCLSLLNKKETTIHVNPSMQGQTAHLQTALVNKSHSCNPNYLVLFFVVLQVGSTPFSNKHGKPLIL